MKNKFDPRKPLSIYGFGNSGRKLASNLMKTGVKIGFFIDQRAEKNQLIEGIPCVKPSEVNESIEQVVLGVFNREASPVEIQKNLQGKGIQTVIGYHELNHYIPGVVKPSFWYDDSLNLTHYKTEIESFKGIFKDDESLNLIDKILKYRTSGKIDDHPYGSGLDTQYFNVDIPGWLSGKDLTMLDCGAFDGDTILSAIENHAPITKAFCFEPDIKNFLALSSNSKKQDKIKCFLIPCATWRKTETIFFSHSEGESSRVMDSSDIPVQAISIDDFVGNSSYDFIKIDVEGADLDTIEGATESIKKCRPYIAAAVYHRPKDLWDIGLALKNSLNSYSFYLRQHGQFCIDTVLYCVPN